MCHKKATLRIPAALVPAIVAAMVLFAAALPASAHGGKEHGAAGFTALKALEKATGLYNRLLSSGKLDAGWEAGLENVTITAPSHEGRKEFEVSFRRSQAGPRGGLFLFHGRRPVRRLQPHRALTRLRQKGGIPDEFPIF